MIWLFIVILAVLAVALYPVVRDFLRQRRRAVPAYVDGLRLALDGRADDAVSRLKEAVQEDTENIDAYIRLGDLFLAQGDSDRALRIHETLSLRRNLDPQDEMRVYRALVRDYVRVGRHVKALALLEELTHQAKSEPALKRQLIELYIATGSWEKCEAVLKELEKIPAQRVEAAKLYVRLAAARAQVNPDDAGPCYEAALRLDPGSVEALVGLGQLQMQRGETERAIRTWEQVLAKAPDQNRLVRERLERAYFEAGRFEDVTRLYEQLLRRVPKDTGLAIALADIYRKKEDLPAAVRLLDRCAVDGDPAVLVALAELHLAQGNPELCRRALADAAIRLRGQD